MIYASSPLRPPTHRSRSSRGRGFTLVEVLLAAVLGTILIFAAWGIATALSRSQIRHTDRLTWTLEKAIAHQTLANAFGGLIMSDSAEPQEDELNKRRDEQKQRLEAKAEEFDPEAAAARFALQPSPSGLRIDNRPAQQLSVTLRSPPIAGGEELAEGTAQAAQIAQQRSGSQRSSSASSSSRAQPDWMYRAIQQKQAARAQTGDSSKANRSSSESESSLSEASEEKSKSDQPLDAGGKPTGKNSKDQESVSSNRSGAASAATGRQGLASGNPLAGIEHVTEPGRAPGVRGVFEVLPEDRTRERTRQSSNDGEQPQTYALWWRALPPIAAELSDQATGSAPPSSSRAASAAGSDTRDIAASIQDAVDSPSAGGKRVKLMSGLTSAEFRVMRTDSKEPRTSATWAAELPAYVEFSFQTIDGAKEDWVFELAWAVGAEPGTVIARGGSGGLSSGSETDLAKALKEATNAATGQSGGTTTADGSKPGTNPQGPTTGQGNQTTIDAAVRQALEAAQRGSQSGGGRSTQPGKP